MAVLVAITIAAQLALAAAAPSSLVVEVVQDLHSYESLLTVGSDGSVYGTTKVFAVGGGTVFRIDGAGNFSTVHTFSPAEGSAGRLVVGHDGALYGVTGHRFFRVSQGVYTDVAPLPVSPVTGQQFSTLSDLVVGSDGAFYTALDTQYCANVPCIPAANGVLRLESNGTSTIIGGSLASSAVPMVVGSDGALYGVRSELEFGRFGSMMRWDASGEPSALHAFTEDEWWFTGGFSLGGDGLLYLVIDNGGVNQVGSVIRASNAGEVTHLHDFSGPDGSSPDPSLTVGSDGSVYGVTHYGGSNYAGTVFRIDVDGAFTSLHSFDSSVDGGFPNHAPMKAKDGLLYGATLGSPNGSIFVVDNAGVVSAYPVLPTDLGGPSSPFVQGNDCALYGIADTWNGQPNTTLYRAFEPGHLCQRIEFAPLLGRELGDPPFTVSATASSGLPVFFHASGSCSVSGNRVTLTGVGVCAVTASQIGDSRFAAAPSVTQEILDNCPTVANASQSDADGDGVGDACDNCVNAANPRVASEYLVQNPWARLTGGQRDDDRDGYGNRCDAKFPGSAGAFVGTPDLAQFFSSVGHSRADHDCGRSGTQACAIYDLDEDAAMIGTPDRALLNGLLGKRPGPKCPACPLTD